MMIFRILRKYFFKNRSYILQFSSSQLTSRWEDESVLIQYYNHLRKRINFLKFLYTFFLTQQSDVSKSTGYFVGKAPRSHIPYVVVYYTKSLDSSTPLWVQYQSSTVVAQSTFSGQSRQNNRAGWAGQAGLARQNSREQEDMFACRRKRGSVENAKERPQEQRDTVRINLGLVRSETASCVRTREVIRSTFLSGVRVFEKSFLFSLGIWFFLQKFQQIYILKKQVYNFILPQGEKDLHTLQYNF